MAADSDTATGTPDPRVTIVFPAHCAADAVAALVAGIGRQRPPAGVHLERWMKVIFVDDGSTDDTLDRLESALTAAKLPMPVRVIRNGRNIGLARSLNRALETVETDYVLTCHADCRFGSDDYVARVVELLDQHPDVAVVSGQSIANVDAGLSQVEKVYLAANLMDIFPDGDDELVPLGFAEGRCDGFRMHVLREVGFYDTTLHRAGEDQVLSARMRAAGYRICRAPGLRYYLSVSSYQDSLLKLVRHAQLFGRAHPYLLIANRGTIAGVAGGTAGRNRALRMTLRALQLAGGASWLALAAAVTTRRPTTRAAVGVLATNLLKSSLFVRYMRALKFNAGDTVALLALQPALDLAYTTGLLKGLWQLVRPGERNIS